MHIYVSIGHMVEPMSLSVLSVQFHLHTLGMPHKPLYFMSTGQYQKRLFLNELLFP
jgi:hypothetical protein